jgi:hypothetical protein
MDMFIRHGTHQQFRRWNCLPLPLNPLKNWAFYTSGADEAVDRERENYPMHLCASGDDSKLLLEADEADPRAVCLTPCGPATWTLALLAGGLVGNGEGGGEQVLD